MLLGPNESDNVVTIKKILLKLEMNKLASGNFKQYKNHIQTTLTGENIMNSKEVKNMSHHMIKIIKHKNKSNWRLIEKHTITSNKIAHKDKPIDSILVNNSNNIFSILNTSIYSPDMETTNIVI